MSEETKETLNLMPVFCLKGAGCHTEPSNKAQLVAGSIAEYASCLPVGGNGALADTVKTLTDTCRRDFSKCEDHPILFIRSETFAALSMFGSGNRNVYEKSGWDYSAVPFIASDRFGFVTSYRTAQNVPLFSTSIHVSAKKNITGTLLPDTSGVMFSVRTPIAHLFTYDEIMDPDSSYAGQIGRDILARKIDAVQSASISSYPLGQTSGAFHNTFQMAFIDQLFPSLAEEQSGSAASYFTNCDSLLGVYASSQAISSIKDSALRVELDVAGKKVYCANILREDSTNGDTAYRIAASSSSAKHCNRMKIETGTKMLSQAQYFQIFQMRQFEDKGLTFYTESEYFDKPIPADHSFIQVLKNTREITCARDCGAELLEEKRCVPNEIASITAEVNLEKEKAKIAKSLEDLNKKQEEVNASSNNTMVASNSTTNTSDSTPQALNKDPVSAELKDYKGLPLSRQKRNASLPNQSSQNSTHRNTMMINTTTSASPIVHESSSASYYVATANTSLHANNTSTTRLPIQNTTVFRPANTTTNSTYLNRNNSTTTAVPINTSSRNMTMLTSGRLNTTTLIPSTESLTTKIMSTTMNSTQASTTLNSTLAPSTMSSTLSSRSPLFSNTTLSERYGFNRSTNATTATPSTTTQRINEDSGSVLFFSEKAETAAMVSGDFSCLTDSCNSFSALEAQKELDNRNSATNLQTSLMIGAAGLITFELAAGNTATELLSAITDENVYEAGRGAVRFVTGKALSAKRAVSECFKRAHSSLFTEESI